MQVTLLLDSTTPRRWHGNLIRRLGEELLAGVDTLPGSSINLSHERGLDRLLTVERVLHAVACDALTPHSSPNRPSRSGAPADVVIDLGAGPGVEATGWTMLYDEQPGAWAAAAALQRGHFPLVSIVDPAGVVRATGRPGSERPGLVATALPDVLAGAVTLLIGALRGHRFQAPITDGLGTAKNNPGTLGRLAVRRFTARVVHGAYHLLTRSPHWRVGWRRREGESTSLAELPGTGWVDLPDDGYHFYADPFLFEHQGRAYLFVEDYDHRVEKAVISVVELGEHGPLGAPRPVLSHDVHLSYPVVLHHDEQVWMVPETSSAGTIELYRATRFPDEWEREAVMVDNVTASDATPFQHEGRWWLTATVRHGGSFSDHLHLWSAPDLRGPWVPHAGNPVLVDIASARPAGHVVHRGGTLLRPTQDCREGYGAALNVMEVTRLDDQGFEQQQVARLTAGEHWPGRRLHTLNQTGGFEVIDGSRLSLRLPRLPRTRRRDHAAASVLLKEPSRPLVIVANPSGDLYGSDLQMLESVEAMVAEGFDVTVTTPDDGPLITHLRARGANVDLLTYPVLRRVHGDALGLLNLAAQGARSAVKLARHLRRHRPSLVYVNTVTLPWWILAARLARVPVLCHVHEAERLDSKPVRLALYLPLIGAHSVVVNSEVTRETVTEVVPTLAKRVTRIYNGVPGPDAPLSPPAPDRDPFRLVLVSRLSPRKGIEVALEALAIVREKGFDARLNVCGTAFEGYQWFEQQLRSRAAQDDLRGAVTFSGYVSPVWPALEDAHVALATSMGESLGNAVIEAQLSGRPVVASEVTGHVETVIDGRTGLLVPASDPGALASAVIRLIQDPALRATLAERALSESLERFSLTRYHTAIGAAARRIARQREVFFTRP